MILTKEQLVAGWRHVQGGFLLQQKDAPTVFVNREGLVWGDEFDPPPPAWKVHSGDEPEALAGFEELADALRFAEAHAATTQGET